MANTRQVAITQDHTKLSADVTYFPWLLTEAQMPDELIGYGGAYQSSDGACTRFYENSNQTSELAREVVSWSVESGSSAGDQLAEVWVAGSGFVLSSSSDTTIYMEYGDNALSDYADGDTYGRNAVYDSNFVSVYHMNEDPTGSAPQLIDSTGNGWDMSAHGSGWVSGDVVSAQVGNGIDFNFGSSQYFSETDTSALGLTDKLSVTGWANTTADTSGRLITKHGSSYGWMVGRDATTDSIAFLLSTTGSDWNGGIATSNLWPLSTNVHIGATYDGSNMKVFADGTEDTSGIFPYSQTGSINDSSQTYMISNDGFANHFGTQWLDQISVSKVDRGSSWIAAEYANQNSPSTFASAGTPGSIGGGGSHPIARTFVGPFGSPLKGVLQ